MLYMVPFETYRHTYPFGGCSALFEKAFSITQSGWERLYMFGGSMYDRNIRPLK